MFLIAILLVLASSVLWTAILRPASKTAYLLSLYLFGFSNLVVTGYVASLLQVMNHQWAYVGLHLLIAALSGYVWWKRGQPSLAGPFKDWRGEFHRGELKKRPALTLLAAGIVATFALAAVLVIVVPPNNNDSLSTHLSRVGYWLQFGSFSPWPSPRVLQLIYPVNAQLQMFWLILFTGSDALVGFVQWTSAIAAALGVFGIARLLGWDKAPAAFAALLYLSYPLVILQSTTTQNDLVTAGLFAPAVYFLMLGFQTKQREALLLSAFSIGLGLGAKQTFYFLLPGLGILALLAWKKAGKEGFRLLVFWGTSSLLAFVLFASYMNIINWQNFGTPFGPPGTAESSVGGRSLQEAANQVYYNAPRLLYQAIDTSGLPRPLSGYAHKVKARLGRYVFDALQFPIEGSHYTAGKHIFSLDTKNENQEDHAWYGPLSFLFLFPAMLYQFFKGIKTKEWLRVGLVLNALTLLLCTAWLRPGWDPFQGRYFAPVIAVNTSLVAGWISSSKRGRPVRWMVVGLALLVAITTILTNPAKPIAGKRSWRVNIWTAPRLDLQTLQAAGQREMLHLVAQNVPPDAALGLYTPGYLFDYPLFGEHFTRRLIPVYPFEKMRDVDWLKNQGIDYLLLQFPAANAGLVPGEMEKLRETQSWALYTWKTP